MAAYRDSADWLRSGVRSGHLVCDTRGELLALAKQLELPDRYFQPYAMLPHYQLPVAYQEAADALGVIFLEREAFTRMVGRIGDRWETLERRTRHGRRDPQEDAAAPASEPRTHPTAATTPSRQDKRPRKPLPIQGALW